MATVVQRGRTWRAQVRINGVSTSATRLSPEAAWEWAEAEEKRIRTGASAVPAAPVVAAVGAVAPGSSVTFRQLCDEYAATVSPKKKGGFEEAKRLTHLARYFDGLANDLSQRMIREWRDERLKVVTPGTVVRDFGLLSAVCTWAVKEKEMMNKVNPFSLVTWPEQNPKRTRRVSDEERAAIMAELGWDEVTPPVTLKQWVGWAWAFALASMMRRGEIANLTWQHVHIDTPDEEHVHLPKTKNGEARDVPLTDPAIALLRMLTRHSDTGRVLKVQRQTVSIYFLKASKAAGVPNMRFHDSRREAITRGKGWFKDAVELSMVSGHRDLKTLKVYYRPDVRELRAKMK